MQTRKGLQSSTTFSSRLNNTSPVVRAGKGLSKLTQGYLSLLFYPCPRRRVEGERESCQKCEDQLSRLRSSQNDHMAMFSSNMKHLVDTIAKNCQQFARPPIGPLGSMIKLRDYSWSTAVEQVLKRSLLYGFVVDNHKDADLLRKMIGSIYRQQGGGGARQQGPKPEVIVSKFQEAVYDVRRNVSEIGSPSEVWGEPLPINAAPPPSEEGINAVPPPSAESKIPLQ